METTINNKKFAKRLQKVMDDNQLSATAFAEKLDIGRATISHLMSGRNKPSLDFIMKVVSIFTSVDLHWLIYGEINSGYSVINKDENASNFHESDTKKSVTNNTQNNISNFAKMSSSSTPIKRVILFLEDGTFESYEL